MLDAETCSHYFQGIKMRRENLNYLFYNVHSRVCLPFLLTLFFFLQCCWIFTWSVL